MHHLHVLQIAGLVLMGKFQNGLGVGWGVAGLGDGLGLGFCVGGFGDGEGLGLGVTTTGLGDGEELGLGDGEGLGLAAGATFCWAALNLELMTLRRRWGEEASK